MNRAPLALLLCSLACGSAPTRAECEAALAAATDKSAEAVQREYFTCLYEAARADPEHTEPGPKYCDCEQASRAKCFEMGRTDHALCGPELSMMMCQPQATSCEERQRQQAVNDCIAVGEDDQRCQDSGGNYPGKSRLSDAEAAIEAECKALRCSLPEAWQ